MQEVVGVGGEDGVPVGRKPAHIGQAEMGAEFALIPQRFGEQQFGVEKQHRRGSAHTGHHMQKHHRFGAKG